MVKTLENNRIKKFTKSRDLSKSNSAILSKSTKSKLEWADEVAKNANLEKIKALM